MLTFLLSKMTLAFEILPVNFTGIDDSLPDFSMMTVVRNAREFYLS